VPEIESIETIGAEDQAMSSSVLLPLIVFFALALPILFLLWRVFVVGGELRRDAAYGRAALDIARRVDVSLTEWVR
jgi:hypothetical protein